MEDGAEVREKLHRELDGAFRAYVLASEGDEEQIRKRYLEALRRFTLYILWAAGQ